MLAHIGGQKKIYRALADSGRLNDFFDLAQGYFARGIERRLRESECLPKLPQREWRLTPLHWPEACCLCRDGGSIAVRKNRLVTWTNCSTGWYGRISSSRNHAARRMVQCFEKQARFSFGIVMSNLLHHLIPNWGCARGVVSIPEVFSRDRMRAHCEGGLFKRGYSSA